MKEKKDRKDYMKNYYLKHRKELAIKRKIVYVNKLKKVNVLLIDNEKAE